MNPIYRVDNRLVHGQIISTWMPQRRLQQFLVVSDSVPDNDLQMTMFRMCIPGQAKFGALPVEQAATWLNDRQFGNASTMVLFETIQDAARLFAAGHPYPALNIGNVHHAPGRVAFTPAVYLGDAELDLLRDLARRGMRIEIRSLPGEAPIPLNEKLGAH